MRAGVEPERIVAGALLLLVAAYAAVLGSAGVLGALLPLSGIDSPSALATGLVLVGFAGALTLLSVVVLAGRRSQPALALAAALVVALVAVVALRGTSGPTTALLVGVAFANIAALLIGRRRHVRR